MAMAIRRARRTSRPRGRLPFQSDQRPISLSRWYCDLKIYTFNNLLHSSGQRYARFLRSWLAIGVAFSVISLVGTTMVLFWEVASVFHLHNWSFGLRDISLTWFWGTPELVSVLGISIMDFAVMVFSTVISVIIHEFGHAVAATSEGVPIEYVAVFLAVIFPGALIAFDDDLLQALPTFASLRIYCAGIWHNAMLCAVCGVALFLLPFTLYPLYIHDENPMVLRVSTTSPLSGYLSRGDVMLSLDGENICSPREFIDKILQGKGSNRKGYCVPNAWLEKGKAFMALDDQLSCSDGLAGYTDLPCLNSSSSVEIGTADHTGSKRHNRDCLSPGQVVKLSKCGDGWGGSISHISHCACSKGESCMTPLLSPGMSWFEISYSSPYSSECFKGRRNTSLLDSSSGHGSYPCGVGTFVYIGNELLLARSMRLSAYKPRWMHFYWAAEMPMILEKILGCTFHVSATLAALNSLPVFFLDGEHILETGLCCITWLTPRRRRKAAQACLTTGTIFSVIAFVRIIYFTSLSLIGRAKLELHVGAPSL